MKGQFEAPLRWKKGLLNRARYGYAKDDEVLVGINHDWKKGGYVEENYAIFHPKNEVVALTFLTKSTLKSLVTLNEHSEWKESLKVQKAAQVYLDDLVQAWNRGENPVAASVHKLRSRKS